MKKTLITTLTLGYLLFSALGIYAQAPRNITHISNKTLDVSFDESNGELAAITYQNQGVPLISTNGMATTTPWKIYVDQADSSWILDIHDASAFSVKKDEEKLILTWNGFKGKSSKLKVIATVNLMTDSAMSSWRIRVEGTNGLKLRKVSFPILAGITPQKEETFAVPQWMGSLLKSPRKYLTPGSQGFAWDYPGHLSMQFMTVYDPNKVGSYISSNDSLGFVKKFRLARDSAGLLEYSIDHYPSYTSDNDFYEPAYEVIVGGFEGNWFDAAQIYKTWAVKQSWSRNSRLYTGKTPEWVNNTSFWVWNRGRASNVLDPASALNEKLGGGVNVLWHWWHQGSYDDSFPEYFPPRDGDATFKSAVSRAKSEGVHSIVYMNALKWGPSTQSWKDENAAPYSVKNIDGSMKSHVYNIFTKKALTYMCEGTDFWKHKYASLVDTALNMYGLSGIYMDQTCINAMCYDLSHQHQPGGGNYWMQHHAEKNRLIRNTFPSGAVPALAAEGVGENWLPYNDMFLALQVSRERYAGVSAWRTIPLFQSVYHEYAITFGNYSSLLSPPYDEMWPKETAPENAETPLDPEFNKQFIMEQARSFIWGMQPMIANYQPYLDQIRTEEIDYIKDLSSLRKAGLAYFLKGEFLRPPELSNGKENVVISKLSIYAGQNAQVTRFEDQYPALYCTAWRAPERSVAFAFASIDEQETSIQVDVSTADYELGESGTMYLHTPAGKKKIGSYEGSTAKIDFILPPLGLAFIEFMPKFKE